MTRDLTFTLNDAVTRLTVDDERRLLWVLRTDLGLTGTKFGCGAGQCGACTVVIDGRPARACTTLMRAVDGRRVLTIEALASGGGLHPLQRAFVEHGAFQCGFCTPGMVMAAYALLLAHPAPTRDEIVTALDRNLCRCGTYTRVIAAVQGGGR